MVKWLQVRFSRTIPESENAFRNTLANASPNSDIKKVQQVYIDLLVEESLAENATVEISSTIQSSTGSYVPIMYIHRVMYEYIQAESRTLCVPGDQGLVQDLDQVDTASSHTVN